MGRLRPASLAESDDDGLGIVAAGTHPFSSWHEQDFTPVDDVLADALDDLEGAREAAEGVHGILEEGTSADRQLAVLRETGSLEAVVDHLMEETGRGVH